MSDYFVMSPESQYAGTGWATVVCNTEPQYVPD
jgi:hypothetical protein